MDYKNIDHHVTVEEMMAFRDRRAEIQIKMRTAYSLPVISFCMNIPGEIKTNDCIRRGFDEGLKELRNRLGSENYAISEEKERHETAGDEWIAAVDAPAEALKEIAISIEENHPRGRLFDIDVLDESGSKLSRAMPRRCLICDEEAAYCARSRRHDLSELQKAVERILNAEDSI